MHSDWRKVGEISVDSGQIIIIDPCYLSSWKHGEFNVSRYQAEPISESENSYDEACRVTLNSVCGEIHRDLGFASSTLYGDGVYNVYARFQGNRVAQLTIDFTDEVETYIDDDGEEYNFD